MVLIVITEVPEAPGVKETEFRLNSAPAPVAEKGTRAESETLPAKPLLPRLIVEVAEEPATKLTGEGGLEAMVKSAVTVIENDVE